MKQEARRASLIESFWDLPDPRVERCREHQLIDIVIISICAVIAGGEGFTDMEEFGRAKEEWLREFLELPNGIPSHDTFGRVWARIKPEEFERRFRQWVQGVVEVSQGEVVGIDGKTLRRSYDRAGGRAAIQLVSAWARSQRLTLGQVKVADESNEITAVPELLRVLELNGCIVTVDALNTQKEIATEIRRQQADYVLALKGNHPTLHEQVVDFLQTAQQGLTHNYQIAHHQTVDGEHGRIETRQYWQVEAPPHLHEFDQWPDLRSIGLVQATREIGDQISAQVRYYLSSLPVDSHRFAEAVRGHWSVENSCHWILDVVFGEDDCRVRTGHAPENLALLRRLALSLLSQEKTVNRSIRTKRLKAAWNVRYLRQILRI
jgi:predicted transposase YbfD/YdcC